MLYIDQDYKFRGFIRFFCSKTEDDYNNEEQQKRMMKKEKKNSQFKNKSNIPT